MKKGELSNVSAGLVGVDYRIFIEHDAPYSWLSTIVPKLLLEAGFDSKIRSLLHVNNKAVRWLETKLRQDFVNPFVFSIGVPILRGGLEIIVNDFVTRVEHFDSYEEFYDWLRFETDVGIIYTYDSKLLTLPNDQVYYRTPKI